MRIMEDGLFRQACRAKLGEYSLAKPKEDLREWLSQRYEIQVLALQSDRCDEEALKGRLRLQIVVDTREDYESLHKDLFSLKPNIRRSILRQYSKQILNRPGESDEDVKNTHLVIYCLQEECLEAITTNCLAEVRTEIVRQFAETGIWKIDGNGRLIVVFYFTDLLVQRNSQNGINDQIKIRIRELLREQDQFGYLTDAAVKIRFDSKENVDQNFEGKLFYYFR